MSKNNDKRNTCLDDLNHACRALYISVDVLEDAIAAKLGILRTDLRCLNVLGFGPQTATEIARKTGLTSGSVTALIDRLETAGFVERTRSKTDRRSVFVAILPDAYPRIDALYSNLGRAISGQFTEANDSDIRVSTEILKTFSKACREAIETISKDKNGS